MSFLAGSSIVKTAGTSPGEAFSKIHLHVGKARGPIHGVTQPGAWPLQGLASLRAAPTRTRGKQGASNTSIKIPASSNGIFASLSPFYLSQLLYVLKLCP
jgi:hypothetical protein